VIIIFNKCYEDYQVGETWYSRGRTLTESDLVNFASLSGDWFPLHTDMEYAKETQFKERIAHGMLVLSISTGLMLLEPGIIVAFYGMDNIRFIEPTFINDTISLEMRVIDKKDKSKSTGVIVTKLHVKKQTGKTVTVGNLSMLVNKE